MKKKLLYLGLAILFGGFSLQAQNDLQALQKYAVNKYTPTHTVTPPSMDEIKAEDLERDRNGMFYRIGVASAASITPASSGLWITLPNGDKLWQLKVKATGAEALSFLFSTFKLYDNASFWVQDMQGKALYRKLTKSDVLVHFQQHVELCFGDEMVLNLLEPAGAKASEFYLDQIMYDYRSTGNPNMNKINESEACQVNVNCTPEGSNWQDEKRGVARILVVDGASQGWCSGTLINNTSQDCKPYFLTALHCGVTSTTTNFNQWKFYFRYEATACTNPTSAGTLDDYFISGCVKKASSNDGGGDTGSDFLLVQLGSVATEAATITTLKSANFNAYWNGWDANNTASNNGVSIHHPAGDIKKISAYTTNTTTAGWNGNGILSHWQMVWSATANGHGVTEGGSSGSPLFKYNGGSSRVIGTLTGGSSFCTATSSPDYYGKMSYHWQSNTTSGNIPLKTFLDPGNTGLLVLDGSSNPCAVVAVAPVAEFIASTTTPCISSTVTFTDLSTNLPTGWAWTFSPTTVTYVGGTSATSQNPQVQFNAIGPYTVALTATNAYGNNTNTKTSYITPLSGAAFPLVENFEGTTFPPTGWTINNPDSPSIAWGTAGAKGLEKRAALGNTGSTVGSVGLDCFNYSDTNQVDDLITIPLILVGTSSPKLTFKRAYKTYVSATNPQFYRDELKVFISSDCGATWGSAVYFKKGAQLATNGTSNTSFTPGVAADWDIDTVNLTSYIGQTIKVKFSFMNRYGNTLYLDDININSVASVASVAITSSDADNIICAGSSVTFTAAPTNGGTTPSYQWKVNGVNAGTNSPTFTTSTLTTGQIVTCVMTSTIVGVSGSPATSNAITTTVNAIPATPTITSSGGMILTSSSPTGNQWYLNGGIIAGATSQNYTATSNGNYTVIVTGSGCPSLSSANFLESSAGLYDLVNVGSHVIIYPNPSSGKFTVVFTSAELLKYKIELHNSIGQIVYFEDIKDFNGAYSKDFDITEYGKGEYFLRITDSKKNQMEKVIIY